MTEGDLEAVLANEKACHPDPWDRSMFRESLSHAQHCLVLDEGGAIRGHAVLDVAGDEAEILNLCIQVDLWDRGLGRGLLRGLLHLAASAGVEDVFLEVRCSNQRAIRLYESEGFARVGTRPGYYPGPQAPEDALIMARSLRLGLPPEPFAEA